MSQAGQRVIVVGTYTEPNECGNLDVEFGSDGSLYLGEPGDGGSPPLFPLPLDDATVERLARKAYWGSVESRRPHGTAPLTFDQLFGPDKRAWKAAARAVVTELIGDPTP